MKRPRRLRSESHFSFIVVIGNYKNGPITVVPHRAKSTPLHVRRAYFTPTETHRNGLVVEAPGTAPGSGSLITCPFIAIVGKADAPNIGSRGKQLKSAYGHSESV